MLIFATFLIIFRKFCGLKLVINKDAFLLRCKLGKTIISIRTIYEDQIIQKIIREHDKLFPRRKSQQYTGYACKGYCNSKKCRCVAKNEKCDDCICPPDQCSNRDTQLPGPSSDIGGKRRCTGESAFLFPAYPCKKFFFFYKKTINF